MTESMVHSRKLLPRAGLVTLVLMLTAACGGKRPQLPADPTQADQFLMDRATEAMQDENWFEAREYYRRIVDSYSGSPLRPDAKLGIGDSYLAEGTLESLVLAASEYREFLTFYPTNSRADYAQYKLAMTHFEQMRAAARDQTETQAALREFQAFFDRFPNSPLMPEAREKWRIARDRLSEASFLVGLHYYRSEWYPGATARFRDILKENPGYADRDDVYFYLAEILARTDKQAEAIPYYERLLEEFPQSEHVEDVQKRLQELNAP